MRYYIGIWCTHPLLCISRFVGDMAEKEELIYDLDLERRPRRNLTKKKDLKRGASDQTEVMYNSYRVPVGKKVKRFEELHCGDCTRKSSNYI